MRAKATGVDVALKSMGGMKPDRNERKVVTMADMMKINAEANAAVPA